MQVTQVDLAEVIESVWTSMLGFELRVTDEMYTTTGASRYLVATVQITGDRELAVMLETPAGLASLVAATMFGMDVSDLGDDEVTDALGELANMIGGNVKGMLPGAARLSLPTVAEGHDYRVTVPGGGVVRSITYTTADGYLLRVQLLAKDDA